jgi:hypothetical protein
MELTVHKIAAEFKLPMNPKCVKWGTNCPSREPGVYIVSLPSVPTMFPVDLDVLAYWCTNTTNATFRDGTILKPALLESELRKYWHPSETIVYIGKAKSLRRRLYQYYGTPLGSSRPHAGGYWIQTLKDLNTLDVCWFEHKHAAQLEKEILTYFSQNVVCNCNICIPYANLQIDGQHRRVHNVRRPIIP